MSHDHDEKLFVRDFVQSESLGKVVGAESRGAVIFSIGAFVEAVEFFNDFFSIFNEFFYRLRAGSACQVRREGDRTKVRPDSESSSKTEFGV